MKKLYSKILKRAARRWISRHNPYVIGVTGSIGKTTCRMIITDVLEYMYPDIDISTSAKNFNSDIGLVLALFEVPTFTTHPIHALIILIRIVGKALWGSSPYDMIVLEYGIDHPGDMTYLTSIVAPHMSIFTGIDKVHAEYFETIDALLHEKMQLMQATKEITFIPAQAAYVFPYTDILDIDVLSYDLTTTDAGDIGFYNHTLVLEDAVCMASFILQQEQEQIMHIHTNVLGQEQAGYMSLGVEIGMILARRLEIPDYVFDDEETILCHQQPGRFTIFSGKFGSTLIDSTYNAAPKSMQKTIENTIRLRNEVFKDRDLLYCLGDMRELGDFTEKEHRALAPLIAQSADMVYLIGETMITVMKDELEKLGYNSQHIQCFSDASMLGKKVLEDIAIRKHLSLVLFKGSQNTIFLEEAIKPLLKNQKDQALLCRQENRRKQKKA